LHHTAVEEHLRRVKELRRARLGAGLWRATRDGARLLAEERGEVTRDGRVLRVRQAESGERRARPRDGAIGGFCAREEAVDERARDLVARELAAKRRAEQRRSARGDRDRGRVQRGIREQALFRDARGVHERRLLEAIDLFALRRELLLREVREREIHVVAA